MKRKKLFVGDVKEKNREKSTFTSSNSLIDNYLNHAVTDVTAKMQ